METIEIKNLKLMVIPLLNWYYKNARVLPWRISKNPYYIWVSEVILQQTRVETGKKYYARLIEELPTISSLASVDDQKLMKLWEGLGYYSRARNLKNAAQIIMRDYQGVIPNTYELLCTLPGIGPYTAGAIASIAYDELVAAVDGNVLRVISRYLAYKGNISKSVVKKEITTLLKSVLPVGHAGDFNQALMELGALICLPNGMPKCEQCPLKQGCQASKMKCYNIL